ncbi:MAG: hypothetical protein ACI4VH_05070 [Clostridia bacterium]
MKKYKSIFFKETEDIEQSKDSNQILKKLAAVDDDKEKYNIYIPRYYITASELTDIFDRVFDQG